MAEIELRSVTVIENGKKVLDNVSMKIGSGEYISVLGPTGSGSSFLLKVIAGLIPVTSGKIMINQIDVTHYPPEDRKIGFVFEQFNLFPHLSVLDNLLYGPRMRDEDLEIKTQIAREILTMVRLDGREKALTRELSGGMQQRVGVARAITAGAEILLLDQPYRALDAKIREEMRYEIRELVKELGLTALHATHEKEEAMVTADRIAVFSEGDLVQIDPPYKIFTEPNSEFTASFLANSNRFNVEIYENHIILGSHKFLTKSSHQGEGIGLIREQSIILHRNPTSGNNIVEGTVEKTRLLGEQVRFLVNIGNNVTLLCRESLSLDHRDFRKLQNNKVYVEIKPEDILIFPK